MPAVNEIAVTFGPDRHLSGTLTVPDTEMQPLGIVLLNAGVIHRIGPHRLNVKMARRLSEAGFASLRFDLSGQGDSRAADAGLSYREQSILDLQAAMDQLGQSCGLRHFAVVGICSGADHGLACALQDDRIQGLWMLDGYAYPTWKTQALLYWKSLARRGAIGSVQWLIAKASTLPALAAQGLLTRRPQGDAISYGRPMPTVEEFSSQLEALVARGVRICMTYSGSLLNTYNYQGQFMDVFGRHPWAAQIECHYTPHLDHTLTPLAAQQEACERVAHWATQVGVPVTQVQSRRAA